MASYLTESLTGSAWSQEENKEEKELTSLRRSSYAEESELEPPLASVVRRKVSFADAFGLDLVSVKEFDNRVGSAEGREKEKLYLSCFFSVPASDEELELRLGQNKLELERIELLPGSSIIRGTVRVLNLSYHKLIYVRTTLDGWQSYFDQLAEYVPGSSNGETDRFSFQLTLIPPFSLDGLRVEFCLCYESSTGIFWANNGGMNYVLFCHQRVDRTVKEKDEEKENESEENNQKGKKSCLKTIIKLSCADSKPTGMSSDPSEQDTSRSVKNKKEKTQHEAKNRSKNVFEESCKMLAERRNRRRAAKLAYLQDCYSNVQLVQNLHAEKSETDLNLLLPIPQYSISVMSNISSTLQECKILPEHQNILTHVDWSRNISSPPPSDTNTSEIFCGTKTDVLGNKTTKEMSKELSDDAWKEFLSGIDSVVHQKHDNALDQKCLLCTARSNATQNSSKPHTVQKLESPLGLSWSAGNEAQHSKQVEAAYVQDFTEQSNSKPEFKVLFEECTSCTSFFNMKVKADTHRIVKNNINVTRIAKKTFIDGEDSFLERQQIDYIEEPMEKREQIDKENKNGSWSEYFGQALLVQENRLQEDAENPSHLKNRNSEIWTLSETSVILDNAEPQKQAEYFDKEKIVAVCFGSAREEFSDCRENQREKMLSVENRESKNGLKTEDQVFFAQSEGEKHIDNKLNKLQNLTETCLHPHDLSTGTRTCSPSGQFTSEGKLLSSATHKNFEMEEILRYRVAQDLQGVGTEVPSSFSRTLYSTVSKLSSWLLICLAKILHFSSMTGAIGCVILFVTFVIAYLHDLSICLAIYLLSACWWCKQGIKKHVTKADSVD